MARTGRPKKYKTDEERQLAIKAIHKKWYDSHHICKPNKNVDIQTILKSIEELKLIVVELKNKEELKYESEIWQYWEEHKNDKIGGTTNDQ
jgi:hypothetical protein